jgi:hypothetical protein
VFFDIFRAAGYLRSDVIVPPTGPLSLCTKRQIIDGPLALFKKSTLLKIFWANTIAGINRVFSPFFCYFVHTRLLIRCLNKHLQNKQIYIKMRFHFEIRFLSNSYFPL